MRTVLAFAALWALLNVAAVVAFSIRRLRGWSPYLVGAAVVAGLAAVIAIIRMP
jgi:hypothetical protein